MLLKPQFTKGRLGVGCQNLASRAVRKQRQRDRDKPAHEVGIAIAAIVERSFAAGGRLLFKLQPYLADAAANLVCIVVGRFG